MGRRIVVAIKRVLDHAGRVRVKPDGSGVETAGQRLSMNPFCKHAVEAAVQLVEAGSADEIVAVSIGPEGTAEIIRTALAMGAHRGVHVEADGRLETLAIAKLLAKIVGEENPDLVLLGKQAVDDDSNHVGQMLAGLLGWPQATFASAVAIGNDTLNVTREVDFGRIDIALPLPAIVTADLRLNTPRNVALPMVMKARAKPLAIRPAADFGIDLTPRLTVESITAPPGRSGGTRAPDIGAFADAIAARLAEIEAAP